MKIKHLSIAVLSAIALVGCSGGSVSATSDQAQSSSTDHSTIVGKIKDIFKSETNSFVVEMPASSMIVEGTKEWLVERDANLWVMPDIKDMGCLNSNEINDLLGYKHQEGTFRANIKSQEKDYPEQVKKILALHEGDICSRIFIRESARSIGGWDRNIDDGDFARAIFINAYVANALETQIISRVGSKVWKSDTEAKEKINAVLSEVAQSDMYHQIVAEAYRIAENHLTKDLTGKHPAPVHFTIADYDVAVSGTGTTILKNGSEWFGSGYISGKKYTVSMESVEGSRMEKRKTIAEAETTTTETKNADSVGVAN